MKGQSPVPPDAFADYLPVQVVYIAPGEYKIMDCTGAHQLFYVEGSALAEWLRDRINAVPRSRSKKQKIGDELRRSDLTAQLAGRTDIEHGHHDSLPRGEHVANRNRTVEER